MLKRALLLASIGLSTAIAAQAQPARTMITGTSDSKSVYENVNNGPQRTTLTRDNKYPNTGEIEIGGFVSHTEVNDDLEQDSFGVYGRMGIAEYLTFEVGVPFVESDLDGSSNSGIGDVELKLDLLAYQDIFQYPFIIPHIDIALDTGDEEEGLGTGETVVTFGISIGTVKLDTFTWILDVAYSFDGGGVTAESNDVFLFSGSFIWDVSDRLAFLVEGRVQEQNRFDNYPYQVKGGLAYKFSRDVQLAVSIGTASDETNISDDQYDLADLRLSIGL